MSANINDHSPPHRDLTKTLRYAVDNGVNPYVPDRSGKSAFERAKEKGKNDLVDLFETKKLNDKIHDRINTLNGIESPNYSVCFILKDIDGNKNILDKEKAIEKILSDHKITTENIINDRFLGGESWLHMSVESPTMLILLTESAEKNGAKNYINTKNDRNLKKSFKYLLKNGINPYTPDQSGKSAYDKAKETGKADLIELFEKYNPDNKENRQKNINSQTANLPPLSDKTPRKANKRSSADDNTLLEKKRHHSGEHHVRPGSIS